MLSVVALILRYSRKSLSGGVKISSSTAVVNTGATSPLGLDYIWSSLSFPQIRFLESGFDSAVSRSAAAAAAAGAAAYQATPAAGYAAVGHTPAAAATYAAQRATTAYEAAAAYQPAAATSYAATASSAPTYDYSYTRPQTYDNAAKTAFYPQPTSTSFSAAAADPAFQGRLRCMPARLWV